MTRTIKEIQQEMADAISEKYTLSASGVAEWRLWTYVVAAAIHAFEVVLDMFRREIDEQTAKVAPGTPRWWAAMSRRWQEGDELLYNGQTAELYYAEEHPDKRLIKVVAVGDGEEVALKVATTNEIGEIIPLTDAQLYDFTGYVRAVNFAGIVVNVISTNADKIRYTLDVYHSPSVPASTVRKAVDNALDEFRTGQSFDARFYASGLMDAVLHAEGVTAVDLKALTHSAAGAPFEPVGAFVELHAGYFDYDSENCTINLIQA